MTLSALAGAILAGCAQPSQPAPEPTQPTGPAGSSAAPHTAIEPVDPERIRRMRPELPEGYEVADVGEYASSPVAFWGFGRGWTADPPECATLVDPAPDGSALGVSGSGPGGIVHVVVVSGTVGPVGLDPVRLGECGRWSMAYGRSAAEVSLVDAPVIDGAATLGTAGTIRNVVESGTETDSRADTFMAYLGDHMVFVTLVTDPGAVQPPLSPSYASDLLVRTVATLRG